MMKHVHKGYNHGARAPDSVWERESSSSVVFFKWSEWMAFDEYFSVPTDRDMTRSWRTLIEIFARRLEEFTLEWIVSHIEDYHLAVVVADVLAFVTQSSWLRNSNNTSLRWQRHNRELGANNGFLIILVHPFMLVTEVAAGKPPNSILPQLTLELRVRVSYTQKKVSQWCVLTTGIKSLSTPVSR